MENNQNHIEEMFKEAFANHEMEVSSKVWAGVQSTLATQASATIASGGLLAKAAAFIGISTLVAIGAVNEYRLATKAVAVKANAMEAEQPNVAPNKSIETTIVQAETADFIAVESKETSPVTQVTKNIKVIAPEPTTKDNGGKMAVNSDNQQESSESQDYAIAEEPNVDKPQLPETKPEPAPQLNKKTEEPAKQNAKPSTTAETPKQEEKKHCIARFTHEAKTFISPDGDGTNDCFTTEDAENVERFHISIWTRSGELVFESSDINFQWCGTNHSRGGELLEDRTMCYYQIYAVDSEGMVYTERNAKGSIMVVR